jgi:sulfatase modifying factor 1
MPRLCLLLLSLVIASAASAVTMAWTPIGDSGNPCDPTTQTQQRCFGAVGYAYSIGTYEVTNAQYSEFLNAVALTDPNQLYSTSMGAGFGGIVRSGSDGSYAYAPVAGRENMPVNYVSFWDSLRFVNWLQNGQPHGAETNATTENGTYTLNGGNPSNVARNFGPGPTIVLASENEWYKAAYYDSSTSTYFIYPTGSNTQPACTSPTSTQNTANCNNAVGNLTPVSGYTGSKSPYGVFDLGGNVAERTDTFLGNTSHVVRGTHFAGDSGTEDRSFYQNNTDDTTSIPYLGFRVAYIPEPTTALLVMSGLLGLAGHRRRVSKIVDSPAD